MIDNKCLLDEPDCKGNCAHCGWHPNEVQRRKKLFHENGLTPCKDGLMRLIIKKDGEEDGE